MSRRGFAPVFILVGILVAVGILIGGVYFLKRVPQGSSSGQDETATWKTYQGNGYSLKYPPDWQEKTAATFESPDVQYDEIDGIRITKGLKTFVLVSPADKTLDQLEQEVRNYQPCQNCGAPQNLSVERIKAGNIDVLKELGTFFGVDALSYTMISQGQKYIVSCNYVQDEARGRDLCAKILATFRFTPKPAS